MTHATSHMFMDQVGTITKVYKHETKQMINTRTYDVFGNLTNQTGSSSGNLGFQSKYFDQESGLNYYYHRYYNPSIGRFINEDPFGLSGGLNMYGFVKNNPIEWIDPFGLNKKKILPEEDIPPCPGSSGRNRMGKPGTPDEGAIRENIVVINFMEIFKAYSNPKLLCCIAICAGPKVTVELVKEVMLDLSIANFIRISSIRTIITIHLTLHAGEEIIDKIKECYNLDCAHLR